MTAAGRGCWGAQDTKHTSSMESASRHTEQKERRAKEEQAAMVVLCRKEHQEAEGWPTCVSALSRSGQARVKRPHHCLLACRPNHPAAAQLLHRPPSMCLEYCASRDFMHPLTRRTLADVTTPARQEPPAAAAAAVAPCASAASAWRACHARPASKYTRHHVPHPDPPPIAHARRQTTVRILHDCLHVLL